MEDKKTEHEDKEDEIDLKNKCSINDKKEEINNLLKNMGENSNSIKETTNNLIKILYENNIPVIESGKITKNKNDCIGEGSFGKVYKGKYGDIEVAIKKLKLHQLADVNEIMHEIKAVSRVSHPRIPKFYGVWKTEKYLHLI